MNKKNVETIYPLSPAQQGMLFGTLSAPNSGIHVEQTCCVLQGNLNITAFEQAWQRVVDRHSILRTAFVWKNQDEPRQVVFRQMVVNINNQDWRRLEPSKQQKLLEDYLQADRQQGFDLSKPPLMRLALFRVSDDSYQFVWSHHHIVIDGWCLFILFKEVLAFYQVIAKNEDLHLQPSRPYKDYITWLKQQDLTKAEKFWRHTLQGFTQPTALGITVEPNNLSASSAEGYGQQEASLSAATTATLKSLARQYKITLNTLIQGIWALLLSRYSNSADVVFGVTVSGRSADVVGIDSMIGLFINTLPLRVKVTPQESFWDWLQDIYAYNEEIRQYEYSSAGQVHQWSDVSGALPLYESLLVFQNYPTDYSILRSLERGWLQGVSPCRGGEAASKKSSGFFAPAERAKRSPNLDITVRQVSSQGAQTQYPLTLMVTVDSECKFFLVYEKSRLDSVNVTLILQHLLNLLQSIVADTKLNLAALLNKISAEQIPHIKPRKLRSATSSPRTPVEEMLVNIWTEVLRLEQVGIDDNFFELGGHSLLATQVMSKVRQIFHLELPLRHLFEAPTVASLAKRIESSEQTDLGLQTPPLLPVARDGKLPLSFAQQRLWFIEQLHPGSFTYNEPFAARFVGFLNVAVLKQSINEIVRRHEVLRTTFPMIDGQPFQAIAPSVTINLPLVDLCELTETQREAEVKRLTAQESQRPFDLTTGPLLRCTLVRVTEQEHIVLFTIHHIISDGWSMGVFVRELAALYEAFSTGKPSPLPELPIQYADFAVWQRRLLQEKLLETQLNYWKQQLGNNLPVLQLPTTRPRAEVKTNRNATQTFVIPSHLSQALQALSRQEDVTLFMTLLAGFQVLLQRYTNQDDIVVGTDIANRNRAELEPLIGFFVNLLVLRTYLGGNPSFQELLKRVRSCTLGAYTHQDLPFDQLVKVLQPERNLSNTPPLFQVLFVLQNAPMPALELPKLTLNILEVENKTARFDLTLFLTETEQGIIGKWHYNADLFAADMITRMTGHFQTLLESAIAQPNTPISALEMHTEAQRKEQAMQKKERKSFKREKFISLAPKAVQLSQEKLIKANYLFPEQSFTLVIQPNAEDIDLRDWAQINREYLERELLKHGAILFRGFNIESVSQFESVAQAICPELFGEYGDLPRAGEGGKVYGSTPYPANKAILFHNESSHLHRFPLKIWFFCVQPAEQGGETPIVDCRKAYQILNPQLRERLADKQLMYVRNFTDGLDVSWQDFFQTNDKKVVENFCQQAKIDYEWYENNGLVTRQVRPALALHPKTGESVFFHQIQLHHIAYLETEVRESLLSVFGEKKLPRNVYYGDGTPIEDSVIAEINEVYQQSQISFPWQKGDILMLDNMLVAHGRNPYVGSRKIVVAMGEMFDSANLENKGMENANAK